jgi:hypothetical protein
MELGTPVAGIKRKTSSAAPALLHIDEGGSRIIRNLLYYSLFVGLDEDDRKAERTAVGTIPIYNLRMYLRNLGKGERQCKTEVPEENPVPVPLFYPEVSFNCHEMKPDHLRLEPSDEPPEMSTRLHGALS